MVKKRYAHQGRKNDLQKDPDLKGHKILATFGRGNGNNWPWPPNSPKSGRDHDQKGRRPRSDATNAQLKGASIDMRLFLVELFNHFCISIYRQPRWENHPMASRATLSSEHQGLIPQEYQAKLERVQGPPRWQWVGYPSESLPKQQLCLITCLFVCLLISYRRIIKGMVGTIALPSCPLL